MQKKTKNPSKKKQLELWEIVKRQKTKTLSSDLIEDYQIWLYLEANRQWGKYDPLRGTLSTWVYWLGKNAMRAFILSENKKPLPRDPHLETYIYVYDYENDMINYMDHKYGH